MEKVIYGMNLLLLSPILYLEYNSGSDKSIFLSFLGVVGLSFLNALFGFFAQLDKKPIYKHYYYSAFGIIVSIAILLSI